MSITDIVTILAIITGPIIGVALAYCLTKRREKTTVQENVLQHLLTTQLDFTSRQRINAINLVPYAFNGNDEIITIWKELMDHISSGNLGSTDTSIATSANEKYTNLNQTLTLKICKSLGYKDYENGTQLYGYTPEAWQNEQLKQTQIQTQLINVLNGEQAIKIKTEKDTYQTSHLPY